MDDLVSPFPFLCLVSCLLIPHWCDCLLICMLLGMPVVCFGLEVYVVGNAIGNASVCLSWMPFYVEFHVYLNAKMECRCMLEMPVRYAGVCWLLQRSSFCMQVYVVVWSDVKIAKCHRTKDMQPVLGRRPWTLRNVTSIPPLASVWSISRHSRPTLFFLPLLATPQLHYTLEQYLLDQFLHC